MFMCALNYLKCFVVDLSKSITEQTVLDPDRQHFFSLLLIFFSAQKTWLHIEKCFSMVCHSRGGPAYIIWWKFPLAEGSLSNVEMLSSEICALSDEIFKNERFNVS